MTARKPSPKKKLAAAAAPRPTAAAVIARLRALGDAKVLAGYARYAIPQTKAFGIPMTAIHALAKELGRDHALAEKLFASGWYEARLLAAFVDDPAQVTREQMERWAATFADWATCDTACFKLFDRSPHALPMVDAWAKREEEFVKRAAFALLASVALHDKKMDDALLLRRLPLIEAAAGDGRNFVKKGVSWALRGIGKRSAALRAPASALARKLAASSVASARFIGKDALRDFEKPRKAKRA